MTQVAPLGSPPATDSDFKIYTARPDVRFLSRGVQPPSPVYVGVNDDLIVACATSQTGETVTVSYRLLRPDGLLVLGQFTIAPPNTRAVTVHTESLAEGFLLSVSCKAAVASTRGQTFVRVFLSDPALGGGQPSYMLMADYVTTAMAPAHPNGRVLAPSEGPGNPRAVTAIVPGIGNDWNQTVPPNARWKVRTVFAQLSTSAAVANRYVTFAITNGGVFQYIGGADKVQAASTACFYGGAALTPNVSPNSGIGMVPLAPDTPILGAGTLQASTRNIDPGDQWSAIVLGVEEWLDNV